MNKVTAITLAVGMAVACVVSVPTSAQVVPSARMSAEGMMGLMRRTHESQKPTPIHTTAVFVNGKKITDLVVSINAGVYEVSAVHMLPVLRALGWKPVYHAQTGLLDLQIGSVKGSARASGIGHLLLQVNGHPYLRMNANALGSPLLRWVRVLHDLGVANGWNPLSNTWTIGMASSSHPNSGGSGTTNVSPPAPVIATVSASAATPATYVNTENSNNHTNDQAYWQRASNDLYISAQTNSPDATNSTSTSLLQAIPNQTLYLFAYADQMNVLGNQVTWQVNSPDATVTTTAQQWNRGNYQATEATFVATKPGIYTVQADMNGTYSVPLVLTIGKGQLASQPFAISPAQMGIQPLPANLPAVAPITQAGVTYLPYTALQNWVPIAGSTNLPVTAMNVVLDGSGSHEWTYRLPVINGQFSGLVMVPFTGSVTVTLFPHYFQTLTQSTANNANFYYPNSAYAVQVTGSAPSLIDQAMLASAQRDYNFSPQYANVADVLLDNSPSMDTAIAAIANFASGSIMYDQQELQTVNYRWQDSWTAWQSSSGICEDYASLAASLLDSVAIPTQTIGGYANGNWTMLPANDNNAGDAHEWDQAWDGSQWVVFDPTWNTDDSASVDHYLTNEFMTNTQSLQTTHLPAPSQTGQAY